MVSWKVRVLGVSPCDLSLRVPEFVGFTSFATYCRTLKTAAPGKRLALSVSVRHPQLGPFFRASLSAARSSAGAGATNERAGFATLWRCVGSLPSPDRERTKRLRWTERKGGNADGHVCFACILMFLFPPWRHRQLESIAVVFDQFCGDAARGTRCRAASKPMSCLLNGRVFSSRWSWTPECCIVVGR